jgi:UDP-N-acetylmuramyl pentapeptide phosphotransferase/UDP-N-acetylglucosamine-1-phosphate transferase
VSVPGGWPAGVGVLAVFAVACIGTWLARRYALAHRLIDQPGARRSHTVATPRGGGIAIVAAMVLALFLDTTWMASDRVPLAAVAIGLLLVAVVGWIDDHRPLSPWIRLAVHSVAAACLGGGLLLSGADEGVALAAAILALVLTNVWNFMDGIDGLAASQALLVALGCVVVGVGSRPLFLPLAMAAACAGFLPYNLPRARIFLGDVGSGALGYLLAALVALQAARAPSDAILLLLPLSAFLIDAALTLGRRVLHGERWWLPHTQHAYQRWARHCARHMLVTSAYAAWTAVMLLNLWVASGRGTPVKMLVLSGSFLVGAITWTWLQRTPHPPGDRE